MKSRKIAFSFIIRSFLLAVTSALFGYISIVIVDKETFFIPSLILLLIVFQIYDLIKYTKNINYRILDYISTLKASELSVSQDLNKNNSSFEQVRDSINDLMQLVHETKYEKEIHKQYLNLIINYIKVGLISYNQKNEIVLINNTAKDILKKSNIRKLEDIKNINPDFFNELETIGNRNNKLINLTIHSENITLTISKSILKIRNETITNITFQDIRNEIVQNEIVSWRRLIKVLRHEILNSITPISTLTDTILSIIENEDGLKKELKQISEEDLDDIRESMKSIKSRSNGLFEFVNIYREIDKIPKPKFEIISVPELINSITPLYHKQFKDRNIEFTINIYDKQLFLNADFSLIQQVIINLIKNSIEALERTTHPRINVHATKINSEIKIDIIDNGSGVLENQINQIFVPLFTTKEDGSGIGLFLSRQIMQLHNGSITVKSNPGKETVFTLSFLN